jgi:ADP-heptose:LPS heptosyltransferase
MHLLVIRTSAMGDVALLTPVIRSMRDKYPDVEITLLTRAAFTPFFYSIPGLRFFYPDFTGRHKGLAGIFRLYRDLRNNQKIDYIIDLHNVIRTWLLRSLFIPGGVPYKSVNKGRAEKKQVTVGKSKVWLKHTVERYCDAFTAAGFSVTPGKGPWIVPSDDSSERVRSIIENSSFLKIGIAPFAKHKLKTWPEENIVTLIGLISKNYKAKFILFGSSGEADKLNVLSKKVTNALVVADQYDLFDQIAVINKLDFMISMDSANMHLAALTGTKVISIWGGTDPIAGFGAWKQPDPYSFRIGFEDLICRPCTVYGKGKCLRGDFACMDWLTPEIVFRKMQELNILPPVSEDSLAR